MIGFTDRDEDVYGLIGEERARSRPSTTVVGGVVALVGAVATIGLILQGSPGATSPAVSFIGLATAKEKAAPAVCETKPFGQCAGMNFTSPKLEKKLYNFSTPAAGQNTCCPEGTQCVSFGPVYGMCMPAFGPPKNAEVAEMITTVAALAVLPSADSAAASDASESPAEPADSKAALEEQMAKLQEKLNELAAKRSEKAKQDAKDAKDAKASSKSEASAEEACATKPFGQCAGMNFTQTKAQKNMYNITAGAQPLTCCPAGTNCVTFGPVWGMCMPSWTPAPASPK